MLWQSRYQAWPRMEEGAQLTFKVPPHGIEFTLPSPKIGVESLPVVDPPWMPHFKTNVDEVTVNQIQHVSKYVQSLLYLTHIQLKITYKGGSQIQWYRYQT